MPVFELDPEAVRCPYPYFDAVRDEQPVVFVPAIECWLVTRYADIVQVARDPATFSSIMPTGPVHGPPAARGDRRRAGRRSPSWRQADARMPGRRAGPAVGRPARPRPPAQARQPGVHAAQGHATSNRASGRSPSSSSTASSGAATVELVSEFAVLLPLTIIAEALGVADDELPRFKRVVRRLRGAHRQPRHRPRRAAIGAAVAGRVLRLLRPTRSPSGGPTPRDRPDLRSRRWRPSTRSR